MASCAAVTNLDVQYVTKRIVFAMETPATLNHANRAAASASACCYRLLPALLRSAACLLLLPAVVLVPQHTSSDLILGIRSAQQQQWPIETYVFAVFSRAVALLLRHTWPSRRCTCGIYGAAVAAL